MLALPTLFSVTKRTGYYIEKRYNCEYTYNANQIHNSHSDSFHWIQFDSPMFLFAAIVNICRSFLPLVQACFAIFTNPVCRQNHNRRNYGSRIPTARTAGSAPCVIPSVYTYVKYFHHEEFQRVFHQENLLQIPCIQQSSYPFIIQHNNDSTFDCRKCNMPNLS